MDESLIAVNLTHWLTDSGTLASATVVDFQIELEFKTTISTLVFLKATYSSDASQNLPSRLVIKTPLVKPVTNDDKGGEVQFYHRLAPALGTPPIVHCLAAIDDGENYVVVLEDFRASHDHPPWPLPPSREQTERALDALARVHAKWWEAPSLGREVGELHTKESLTTMVNGISANLPAFIDTLGDTLTIEAREIYERVFGSSLRPWLRLTDPGALTIIHGDAHSWNFLFPRSGEGPAYLIDWQLWHIDVGARDLAFLIALHWYPSRRRELESHLIRHYHDGLVALGVKNYSLDELWLDYRRSVVRNLTIPIIFWSRGMKPDGWLHRLECAIAAYRDLNCDELL